MNKLALIYLLLTFLLPLGCASTLNEEKAYIPGLGEFMTQLAYRHGKLWYAGQAHNWQLAAYELDEIKEGLDDTGHFHPSHHDVTAIPAQIQHYLAKPIEQTASAIQAKNSATFTAAYDAITAGCNACHKANGFGFNVITRPTTGIFSNQQF